MGWEYRRFNIIFWYISLRRRIELLFKEILK